MLADKDSHSDDIRQGQSCMSSELESLIRLEPTELQVPDVLTTIANNTSSLPTYLLNYLPTYLPTYQPAYIITYPPTYIPTYLPTHLPNLPT